MSVPTCTPPQKLTHERFVNLFTTQIQRKDNSSAWVFASRKKNPGIVGKTADAVVIVALIEQDATTRLVLTREFRAPLGRFELSLPSGLIDEGEDAATAAAREFHEETGLTLTRIVHTSPPLASSAGLTDETVSLVFGEAAGDVSPAFQTEHEDIETRLVDLEQIREILRGPKDVISSRLYPILLGYLSAGRISLP
jgi:ADP-ribose pyrophosphatase